MLSHSLSALRPTLFQSSAVAIASRRAEFENTKMHKLKYRSSAKEHRKQRKRLAMTIKTPQDLGEDIPLFYTPARYKLLVKCYAEAKGNTRFGRKPMPPELKKEFIQRSKEYNQYKNLEIRKIEQEQMLMLREQIKAFDASLFLPDYLFEEVSSEQGGEMADQKADFKPSTLYMEQILNIFPREYTARMRLQPAYNEIFMKYDEKSQRMG